MKKLLAKRSVQIAIGTYLLLWAITAFYGLPSVDRRFDQDLAMGSVGWGGPSNVKMPVTRIEFLDARDPMSSSTGIPDTPWRCRSGGVAVAPFLIVDEAAWQTHILSGFAGKRLIVWVFGFTTWVPIKQYWVS